MLNRHLRTIALCALTAACTHKPAPASKSAKEAAAPQAQSETGQASQAADAGPESKELGARESLPAPVRGALSARMGRHGEQLTYLLADVVLLDFESAEQLGEDIAAEPPLARPLPGDKESLNAMLPNAFFEYQDQLKVRAARLGRAAKAKDRVDLVAAFGALAETCVGCHAAYLYDESSFQHQTEPEGDEL